MIPRKYHPDLKSSLEKWRRIRRHISRGYYRGIVPMVWSDDYRADWRFDTKTVLNKKHRQDYWSTFVWKPCGFCDHFDRCSQCPLYTDTNGSSFPWCHDQGIGTFMNLIRDAFILHGDLSLTVKRIDKLIAHMKTLNHRFYEEEL